MGSYVVCFDCFRFCVHLMHRLHDYSLQKLFLLKSWHVAICLVENFWTAKEVMDSSAGVLSLIFFLHDGKTVAFMIPKFEE